ncbi:hypothetical protein DXB71_14370 [Blautia sp. OM05-6]|jgi:hypothetical protein|uniref:hypothetical protein n=1 Tax=Blautia sp. OM05-6 TaxID=2292983 RepID=UPI000E470F50|nr:hypothetical protein [Blautia sp. OM05-6]RHV22664.1 hypothetical protein DXB71_14370 [Blautia sp. OM05-6]
MNKNLLGGEGEKERREKNKKISTHLLTVLTTSVIVRLEQRKKRKFTSTLFLFGANVSTQIDKEEADYEYQ